MAQFAIIPFLALISKIIELARKLGMHEGAVVGFRTVVQEVEATQFLLGLHFISHILVVTIQWSLERGLKQIFYMKLY